MSTRVIASVGVILCAAMTSFSIYLGAVEHVYTQKAPSASALSSLTTRQLVCERFQRTHNTTTTSGEVVSAILQRCPSPLHSTR